MSRVRNGGQNTQISSDEDLVDYLQDRLRGVGGLGEINKNPVLEYTSLRDFSVEPLEVGAVAYLVNVMVEDASARPQSDNIVECWVPDTHKHRERLRSKLDTWGYDIVDVGETNRTKFNAPLIACTAKKSPCEIEQFRALSAVDPEPSELLDAWVLVIQNKYRAEQDEVTPEEWASIRGVSAETVKENASNLGDSLRENGGIPGSQWEIQLGDGVNTADGN